MKKLGFTIILLAAFIAVFFVVQNAQAEDTRVVTCLGDSVTHGYPYLNTDKTYPAKLQVNLRAEYGNDSYDVSNRGVSGYRADQVLAALQSENWLSTDNPDFVLLMVGGNDLAQYQSIESTVSEVQQILDVVNRHTNADGSEPEIILSAFIPNLLYGVLGSAYVNQFNQQLESNVSGIDLYFTDNWTDFYDTGTSKARTALMADDTHPNEDGYTVMASNWQSAINTFPAWTSGDAGGDSGSSGKVINGKSINPQIIVTSGPGEAARMKIYNRHGYPISTEIKNLFPKNYMGGAGAVAVDANQNGVKDQVLVFAVSDGGPQARVFDVHSDGELRLRGQQFVFDKTIRDGLSMAVGDYDGDGFADDAAACLTGDKSPTVRIYKDVQGVDSWEKIGEFTAPFGDVGCNVGTFQYDDKADEILVSPHHGPADPNIYIYTTGGTKKAEFAAYAPGVTNGLTASGINDRIYATPNNGSSHVMALDKFGAKKNFWWAYAKNVRGDFKNVPGDIDLDGKDEILISPIGANGPQVLAFEPDGHWRTYPNFFGFGDKTLRNGVSMAVIENFYGEN